MVELVNEISQSPFTAIFNIGSIIGLVSFCIYLLLRAVGFFK
jgi:hypothetical protein